MPTERWPRPGYPLVPRLLRNAWHSELLPEVAARVAGLSSVAIGDLDESVWGRIDDKGSVEPMANHLRWLVTTRLYHMNENPLATRRLFGMSTRTDLSLADLPFTTRTRNVLRRAGRLDSAEWITDATPFEILSMRNAGATTLLDFATVVEKEFEITHEHIEMEKELKEVELAKKKSLLDRLDEIGERHPIDEIRATDPRLKLLSPGRDASVREALASAIDAAGTPDESTEMEQTIDRVAWKLDSIAEASLEDTLDELLTISVSEPHRVPVARRLGWDGQGGCTLQEAGDIGGVTRERIRQLTDKMEQRLESIGYMPSLDRAIESLTKAARRLDADSSDLLVTEGIAAIRFLPKGVETAAGLFGRPFPVRIGRDGVNVSLPEDDATTRALADAFRSLSDVNHVAHIEELQSRAAEGVGKSPNTEVTRGFLERQGVVWLDAEKSWFWNRQAVGRDRYLNLIRKILSVANPVSLETLREGVFRYHRTHNTSLPRRIFEALCANGGFEVADGCVSSPEPLDPVSVLGGTELKFLEVLSEHGGALDLYELRRQCFERGMSRPAFQVYLGYAPILERLAPAVYALRGRYVDPAEVSILSERAPTYPKSLQDHGWTRDKSYWLSYRVTEPVLNSNVLVVPSEVKKLSGQRRLDLIAIDGTDMGEFVIGPEANAWGISRFMRTRGVDVGDVLVVTMDFEMDIAMIQSGSRDLLLTFSNGDGWGPRRFLEELTGPGDAEDLE